MVTKHIHSRKLTEAECEAICILMEQLIAGHETLIAKCCSVQGWQQSNYCVSQVSYSKNCCSAYRHAIAIARQRAGLEPNVNGPAVQ